MQERLLQGLPRQPIMTEQQQTNRRMTVKEPRLTMVLVIGIKKSLHLMKKQLLDMQIAMLSILFRLCNFVL